jgi:hypothetical protein
LSKFRLLPGKYTFSAVSRRLLYPIYGAGLIPHKARKTLYRAPNPKATPFELLALLLLLLPLVLTLTKLLLLPAIGERKGSFSSL